MVKVKICGLTNVDDALAAVRFGADALGFLVGQAHPSTSRFITPLQAREIVAALPPFCSSVMVTHLTDSEQIINAAATANVTTIQLHGDSSPATAIEIRKRLLNIKLYRVIHVLDATALDAAQPHAPTVDGFVLDTADLRTGQVGGTGKTHDWSISRRFVKSIRLPIILAGGLNPENVGAAISTVRPYAVDVNSGVSREDWTKDYTKLQSFISRAKAAR